MRCCDVPGTDFILGQIHLLVIVECDWSDCGKVSLYLLECTDCRVWTGFSLAYCIEMTPPGFCRWRIWKNRVCSCAVLWDMFQNKGGGGTFRWNFECFQICAATFERVCLYLKFGCAYSLVHLPDNAAISGENVQFQCTVLLNVINRHFLPC